MAMSRVAGTLSVVTAICMTVGCICPFCDAAPDEARYAPAREADPQALISAGADSLAAAVEKLANKYPAYELQCGQSSQLSYVLQCDGKPLSISGEIIVYFDKDGPAVLFRAWNGLATFGHTKTCKDMSELKAELEEFTGPLKMTNPYGYQCPVSGT